MRRVPRFMVGAVGQASRAGFYDLGPWLGPLALAGMVAVTWTQPSRAQSCGGVERWAVKVGSDTAAATITLTSPVATTVHTLIQLPRPTVPSDETTRTSAETTVRVVDARLVKFKLEAGKSGDSDFHLVLADDLLQNPGFESGNTGWTTTEGVISTDQNQPARTGTVKAWLGGYGETHTDRLSQSVTIPSTATAASLCSSCTSRRKSKLRHRRSISSPSK
jgi:hypothetical protein